jgi:hypothetical protein
MSRDEAHAFNQPVDPALVPGYLDIIHRPMDFGTIKNKLRHQEYADAYGFVADIRQVFDNCFVFNPKEHALVRHAATLQHLVEHTYVPQLQKVQPLEITKAVDFQLRPADAFHNYE